METDPHPQTPISEVVRDDRSAVWAAVAILTAMCCQLVFLLHGCDWDFSGDEAEFWTWSQRLDWSYFARGPLIALLIWLPTKLLGGLSQAVDGSLMFAARLPAVLLGGLTAWGVFRLGELASGSRRAGMLAVLILPAIPVLAVGATLMNCDTPLVCCWTWAAVWALRALTSNGLRNWVATGLIGAVGVLAKYTMLAFPASLALFLMIRSRHRRLLAGPGFWTAVGLCVGLGLAPILVWNVRHDWVGLGQLADRVGLSTRARWGSIWPVLAFLGGEVAALGGIWWVVGIFAIGQALVTVVRTDRAWAQAESPAECEPRGGPDQSALVFLLCQWGTIWTACLVASLIGETEVNWMAAGYVPVVVLIGIRIDSMLARRRGRAIVYLAAWCASLAGVIAIHHTEWFYPSVSRLLPPSTRNCPAPLRRYDPTARMRGHKALSQAVAQRLSEFQSSGLNPFVLTPTYGLASSLCFYLPGHPETYCLSWNPGMTADPVNQHDLWHPNPRHDPEVFMGRPAIVVDDANYPPCYATHLVRKGIFGSVEEINQVVVRERGVVVGAWNITVCRDYRGLAGFRQSPPVEAWATHRPRPADGEQATSLVNRVRR
ncbi:MAG: glycosyltransferase family 39 protein [Isosphaeraceae bacterium]